MKPDCAEHVAIKTIRSELAVKFAWSAVLSCSNDIAIMCVHVYIDVFLHPLSRAMNTDSIAVNKG